MNTCKDKNKTGKIEAQRAGSKRNIVIMSGDLTLDNAVELKTAIIKSLENAEEIVLDLEGVTYIDLSCLQVLCATHKSTVSSNKSIELKSKLSAAVKQSILEAGYLHQNDCPSGTLKNCFWARK